MIQQTIQIEFQRTKKLNQNFTVHLRAPILTASIVKATFHVSKLNYPRWPNYHFLLLTQPNPVTPNLPTNFPNTSSAVRTQSFPNYPSLESFPNGWSVDRMTEKRHPSNSLHWYPMLAGSLNKFFHFVYILYTIIFTCCQKAVVI